ncbi:MAG: RNA-binding cell elongation regulator Jag/EloR, partial [Acidimicrobiales bacterium]
AQEGPLMDWVEITARTVEEAREKALDLLGAAEDDTEVEVLAEPKMGLFGRVREEARVRARLLPALPRSKDDSGRRRRSGPRGPKDVATPAPAPAQAPSGRAPAAPRPRRAAVAVADDGDAVNEPKDEPKMESTMPEDRPEVPVAEQAEVARHFVEGLLATTGVEGATVEVVLIAEDTAEVQVTGGELGWLIGPKGATLLALQDLARTVVQRKTGARTGRLLLDVAGYRQKRKQALERFTQKVAEDVLASGAPVALEPMSSADRKIVHDTANAIEGVATSSEGEDPRRHVVVHPA